MLIQIILMINRFVFHLLNHLLAGVRTLIQTITLLLFGMIVFLGINLINSGLVNAQTSITLRNCYDSLEANFPLVKQKEKLMEITELKIKNLQTNYLPDIYLKGKVTYQSEVTAIPIQMPTVPEVPKDQYSAFIDVTQVIYDGGNTQAAKKVTQQNLKVEIQKVAVDIYKLKEQINQLYFTCLMIQENDQILQLTHQTLTEQRKVVSAAVEQGMINSSELDYLDAERLKLEQQMIELETGKSQALMALSELTGFNIPQDALIEIPVFEHSLPSEVFRPEHQLFDDQVALLDATVEVTSKKRMPTLGAFVTAGYGRPGYDMFSDNFHGYYMAGAQLQWNIWDWKQTQREKNQIHLQKQLITDNREVFNKNLNIAKSQNLLQIEKLNKLMAKDAEIVELQNRITERSASQLANGIITSAEYLRQLNADKQARVNKKVHEIQKTQMQADYLFNIGK